MGRDIREILEELFKLIGVDVKIDIKEEGDGEEKVYKVELDPGESAGLLIGAHGMTLSSLASFVTIALKQKTGNWVKISLDVAGWGEKQNEKYMEMAKQTAERVRQTGGEQKLYNLTPAQRRMVHVALKDEKDVETVSEGEGIERYLIVRLK